MPEKFTLTISKIDFDNIPSSTEIKIWIKSMNFTPAQYSKLCENKNFMNIMEQPLETTQKLVNEILGIDKEEGNAS